MERMDTTNQDEVDSWNDQLYFTSLKAELPSPELINVINRKDSLIHQWTPQMTMVPGYYGFMPDPIVRSGQMTKVKPRV